MSFLYHVSRKYNQLVQTTDYVMRCVTPKELLGNHSWQRKKNKLTFMHACLLSCSELDENIDTRLVSVHVCSYEIMVW